MLIAHAASTCDVCLDVYTENISYHSIPCGHVFCLPCLVSTSPARCPLCRHEFSSYTMRKLHLTLPSARDVAARGLEMKLVQSSPDMSLAESLTLFQEVQDWLEGESQEEFLVLRAFAAVLCGFHETKDKLLQNQTLAEKNQAELKSSLEEVHSALKLDLADYKTKYKAVKSELAAARAEYAKLHAQAEQQRNTEIQAHYAQIQEQAELQVRSQSEVEPVVRRISNPLPAPPRPVEIPFLKLIEPRPTAEVKDKNNGKQPAGPAEVDQITSAFVPTLSTTITTTNHGATAGGRSEVTTLVFKPPKRMPMWDSPNAPYAQMDDPARVVDDRSDSSRPDSYAGTTGFTEPLPAARAAPPEPSGRSDRDRRPHQSGSASRPASSARADPPPAPPTLHQASSPEPSTQRQWHDPQKRSRPSYPAYPFTSRPVSYAGWPEVETPPTSLERAPAPAPGQALRPAWQGGTATGTRIRRASSPGVHASAVPNREPAMVATEDRGSRDRPPASVRLHTVGIAGDNMPTSPERRRRRYPRHPSPSLDEIHPSGMLSEPEFRLPARGVGRLYPSPDKAAQEAAQSSKRSQHGTNRKHGHTSSLEYRAPVAPPRLPSPSLTRAHAHLLLNPYLSQPHSVGEHNTLPTSRRYPADLSPTRPVNTFPFMDVNGPSFVPVGEV